MTTQLIALINYFNGVINKMIKSSLLLPSRFTLAKCLALIMILYSIYSFVTQTSVLILDFLLRMSWHQLYNHWNCTGSIQFTILIY